MASHIVDREVLAMPYAGGRTDPDADGHAMQLRCDAGRGTLARSAAFVAAFVCLASAPPASARSSREPELAVRVSDGVQQVDVIPSAVLIETATDLWRVPESALGGAARMLREVPGSEIVVRGIGTWMRPRGATRVAWVDGRSVYTLDLAAGREPRTSRAGTAASPAVRAMPSPDGSSALIETSHLFDVDHEERRLALLAHGRVRTPSPPIQAREGFFLLWVAGAGRFAASSFEAGTAWTWSPGAAQPSAVFRADPAESLVAMIAGPTDGDVTLVLENEATGVFGVRVLSLRAPAAPSAATALPPGVWQMCQWSPDGTRLAGLRTFEGRMRVSVLERDGGVADEWMPPTHDEEPVSLAWASDGRRVWLGTRTALRTWTPAGYGVGPDVE